MTCCMFTLSILHVLQSVDRNSEVLHQSLNDNDTQQYLWQYIEFLRLWSLLNKTNAFDFDLLMASTSADPFSAALRIQNASRKCIIKILRASSEPCRRASCPAFDQLQSSSSSLGGGASESLAESLSSSELPPGTGSTSMYGSEARPLAVTN